MAKLDEEKVKKIRELYDAGVPVSKIHEQFNKVTKKTLSNVCARRTWKSVK